eukprot:SAG11_NODE_27581_length_331_cov_0.672414_1_plen_39_part_10
MTSWRESWGRPNETCEVRKTAQFDQMGGIMGGSGTYSST